MFLVEGGSGRLRTCWRILVHAALIAVPFMAVHSLLARGWLDLSAGYLWLSLFVVGVTAVCRWHLDARTLASLGWLWTARSIPRFLSGMTASCIAVAAAAWLEWSEGWSEYRFEGPALGSTLSSSVPMLVISLSVVLTEELTVRGYQWSNLEESLSSWGARRARAVAWTGTSVLFAALHLANPHMTALAFVSIALGGAMLGIGKAFACDLAMPLGAHFGWNFAQACLNIPVSGQNTLSSLHIVERVSTGPTTWTGGSFGIEGGLLGMVAIAIAATLCAIHVRWCERDLRGESALGDRKTR